MHFSITIGGRDQRRDRKPPLQEEWELTRPSFYPPPPFSRPLLRPGSLCRGRERRPIGPRWHGPGGGGWPAAVPRPVWGWAGGARGAGAMWSQDGGGPGQDRPGLAGVTAGLHGWTWGCGNAPVLSGGCDYYHNSCGVGGPAGGGALPPATLRVGPWANAAGLGAPGPGGVGCLRRGGGGCRDMAGGSPPSAVPQSPVAPLRLLPLTSRSPVAGGS